MVAFQERRRMLLRKFDFRVACSLCFWIAFLSFNAQNKPKVKTMVQKNELNSAMKIVRVSEQLTGLGDFAEEMAVGKVIISNSPVPFLFKKVEQKKGWYIDYKGVSLAHAHDQSDGKTKYVHDFKVLLNDNGCLISVISVFSGNDPDMKPIPSAKSAQEQMQNEEEIYIDFVNKCPSTSFVNALEIINIKGMGDPYAAKEIFAVLVLHATMDSKPREVWSITLRGIPPLNARGAAAASIPVWQRNHMRNVIDAETGEFLFATNSPQWDDQ
jgi:hypothetical protein